MDALLKYVYPDSHNPIYQVISAIGFGLIFGVFHVCFFHTVLWYSFFEATLWVASWTRPHLYNRHYRVLAWVFGILSICISKRAWQSDPTLYFLPPK